MTKFAVSSLILGFGLIMGAVRLLSEGMTVAPYDKQEQAVLQQQMKDLVVEEIRSLRGDLKKDLQQEFASLRNQVTADLQKHHAPPLAIGSSAEETTVERLSIEATKAATESTETAVATADDNNNQVAEEEPYDCKIDGICKLDDPASGIPVVLVTIGRSGSSSIWEIMSLLAGQNFFSAREDAGQDQGMIGRFMNGLDPQEPGQCWMERVLCKHQQKNLGLPDWQKAAVVGTKYKPYFPEFNHTKSRQAFEWIAKNPHIKVVFSERNPLDVALSNLKHSSKYEQPGKRKRGIKSHCAAGDKKCIAAHAAEAAKLVADPDKIMTEMRELISYNEGAKQMLQELGVPRVEVMYEKLYYSEDAEEWKKILRLLGKPNEDLTMQVVNSKMANNVATGGRERSGKMSNWDELEAALRATDLAKYLDY